MPIFDFEPERIIFLAEMPIFIGSFWPKRTRLITTEVSAE
jgi:hypothetical protein